MEEWLEHRDDSSINLALQALLVTDPTSSWAAAAETQAESVWIRPATDGFAALSAAENHFILGVFELETLQHVLWSRCFGPAVSPAWRVPWAVLAGLSQLDIAFITRGCDAAALGDFFVSRGFRAGLALGSFHGSRDVVFR